MMSIRLDVLEGQSPPFKRCNDQSHFLCTSVTCLSSQGQHTTHQKPVKIQIRQVMGPQYLSDLMTTLVPLSLSLLSFWAAGAT